MPTQNHQSSTGEELTPGGISSGPLTANRPFPPSTEGIKVDIPATSTDQKELEIKLKFGEETHQYVRDYIRQADQKAAFFFAGATALLAYLNTLGLVNKWLINPSSWGLIHILSFAATLGLVIGCIFCALTIMPRLDGTKRGLIFFNAIAEYENGSEYAEDVLSRKINQLCDTKYKHIYELSDVCRSKYKSLTYGFKFGMIGVFSAFILLAFN